MSIMRDTIFLSHATPEDNEFTIWLASRLELLGYKVWIDKSELLGGEVFWADIEDAIKNKAIKVLLIYSKNILDKNDQTKIKTGIQKEIDFASEVIKSTPEVKDFLTLLHLDDAPFDLFPGSKDLNQIPFNENWAQGLDVLLKKFQKDGVPKSDTETHNSFSNWYLEHYLIKNPIVEKRELYYTNWWSVDYIPEQFFIYRFQNEEQAKAIFEANKDSLLVRNANCITTFEGSLNFSVEHDNELLEILPSETHPIKISELILGIERESFPNKRDSENAFKKLFKRVLHILFRNKGMKWYELANKSLAYYHTTESLPSSKVKFIYPKRPVKSKIKNKTKSLYGKYHDDKWHYAISLKPILAPYLGFNIKSHIVFTNDGINALQDKDLLHSYRRKKGKMMFNEEWRDLLLGFLSSFKNRDEKILINVSKSEKLIMKSSVELFWSNYGYFDPKDKNRQSIFTYEEDDELIDETELKTEIEP